MTRSFICMVEQGRARPSLQNLRIIADRLGCPLSVLLEEERVDNNEELIRVLLQNASLLQAVNQRQKAIDALDQAHRLCLQSGHAEGEVEALERLGVARLEQGEYRLALPYLEDFLDWARRLERPELVVRGRHHLGNLYSQTHQFLAAQSQYRRGLKETEGRKRMMPTRQILLIKLADSLLHTGELEAAGQLIEEAIALHPYLGESLWLARAQNVLAQVRWAQNRYAQALRAAESAVSLLDETAESERFWARCLLGTMESEVGHWEAGFARLTANLDPLRQQMRLSYAAFVHAQLAGYYERFGPVSRAVELCQEALRMLAQEDDPWVRTIVLIRLSGALRLQGDRPGSLSALQMAGSIANLFGHRDWSHELGEQVRGILAHK